MRVTTPEQQLADKVSSFLAGVIPEYTEDYKGFMRQKSLDLGGGRLLHVSQSSRLGGKNILNIVQVMEVEESTLPRNYYVDWHTNGSEIRERLMDPHFDVTEVLDEASGMTEDE